jgi:capsid protein
MTDMTLAAPSGLSAPGAAFGQGPNGGNTIAFEWANFRPRAIDGYSGTGLHLNPTARQHGLVASISYDLADSNPVISGLIETLSTIALGPEGLVLSFRVATIAELLDLTVEEARKLSHDTETLWRAYAASTDADMYGQHTLHQIANGAFRHWLVTGEALVGFPANRNRHSDWRSSLCLFASSQIATDKTLRNEEGWCWEGVQYSARTKAPTALWIREQLLGESVISQPMPVRVPFLTSWGRHKLLHVVDLTQPRTPRGSSPLQGALSAIKRQADLDSNVAENFAIQNLVGLTVKSHLPTATAQRALDIPEEGRGLSLEQELTSRAKWYGPEGAGPIDLSKPRVVFLHPQDELQAVEAKGNSGQFKALDESLTKQIALASGTETGALTGYENYSFSAARIGIANPWLINERRREAIAAKIYRAAFMNFFEEAIESGRLSVPDRFRESYWSNRKLIVAATAWRGPPKVEPNPESAVKAAARRVHLGVSSLTSEAAALGRDYEDIAAERAQEIAVQKSLGIYGIAEGVDTVADQNTDRVQENVEAPEDGLSEDEQEALDAMRDRNKQEDD